jgi:hypothetical protein
MKQKITTTAGGVDPTWFADYVKNLNPIKHDGDGAKTTKILEHKIKADKEVIERMIYDFISQTKSKNLSVKSNNLGLDFYDDCLMVWLEVDDRDEETKYKEIEKDLNEKYKITGFHLSSMIVSDWKGLPCPPNYITV